MDILKAIKNLALEIRMMFVKPEIYKGRNHTKGAGKTVKVKRYKGRIDIGLE